MIIDVSLKNFTPSEVADLTGVSTSLQRDWRRRGLIDVNEGFGRISLKGFVEIFLTKEFSTTGLGPTQASIFTRVVLDQIILRLLNSHDAWVGNWDDLPIKEPDLQIHLLLTQCMNHFVAEEFTIFWGDGSFWGTSDIVKTMDRRRAEFPDDAAPFFTVYHRAVADRVAKITGNKPLGEFRFVGRRPG